MQKIKRVLYPSGYNPYYLDSDNELKYFPTLNELKEHYGIVETKISGTGWAMRNGKKKTWDEYEVIQ